MSLFNKIRYGIIFAILWSLLILWAILSFPMSAIYFMIFTFFADMKRAIGGTFILTSMLYEIMNLCLAEYKQYLEIKD